MFGVDDLRRRRPDDDAEHLRAAFDITTVARPR